MGSSTAVLQSQPVGMADAALLGAAMKSSVPVWQVEAP